MSTVEIPLPNDEYDGSTVVASCWQDDERGFFTLLLLNEGNENCYYRVVDVMHGAITDDEPFPNIIPAAEAYSDAIGGF